VAFAFVMFNKSDAAPESLELTTDKNAQTQSASHI